MSSKGIPILLSSIVSVSVIFAISLILNEANLAVATIIIVLIIFGADAATLKCLYCFTPIASGSSFAQASNNLSKFDTPVESGFDKRIRFKTVVKFWCALS